MWTWLDRWLDVPWKRNAFKVTCVVLTLLILRLTAGTVWHERFLALVLAGFAIWLMRRTWHRWTPLRRRVMRREMRFIRSWRKLAARPAVVEVLHLFALALAFAAMVATIAGWTPLADGLAYIPLLILALAGLIDAIVLTSRVLKYAWIPAAGKVLSVTLVVALAAVSLSLAKSVTYALAGIDPRYLTEFTAVLACCLLPFVYFAAVSALLAVLAIVQIIGLVGALVATMLLQQLRSFFLLRWESSMRLYWYRIIHGRQPPGRRLPAFELLPQGDISMIAAPLSKIALAYVIWSAIELAVAGSPLAAPAAAKVLVFLEYRQPAGCANIPPGAAIAYMDGDNVSVATKTPAGYRFDELKCAPSSVAQP